tara:strand:+ start:17852 stop:18808 length:957 start_codon:yes stop_codon:yes gene_type:complete
MNATLQLKQPNGTERPIDSYRRIAYNFRTLAKTFDEHAAQGIFTPQKDDIELYARDLCLVKKLVPSFDSKSDAKVEYYTLELLRRQMELFGRELVQNYKSIDSENFKPIINKDRTMYSLGVSLTNRCYSRCQQNHRFSDAMLLNDVSSSRWRFKPGQFDQNFWEYTSPSFKNGGIVNDHTLKLNMVTTEYDQTYITLDIFLPNSGIHSGMNYHFSFEDGSWMNGCLSIVLDNREETFDVDSSTSVSDLDDMLDHIAKCSNLPTVRLQAYLLLPSLDPIFREFIGDIAEAKNHTPGKYFQAHLHGKNALMKEVIQLSKE